jgi:hypothetical protein
LRAQRQISHINTSAPLLVIISPHESCQATKPFH